MADIKLKPCKCGRSAKVIGLYDAYDEAHFGFVVSCPVSNIFVNGHSPAVHAISQDEAIAEWNRRADNG